jgi:hypothetical protein
MKVLFNLLQLFLAFLHFPQFCLNLFLSRGQVVTWGSIPARIDFLLIAIFLQNKKQVRPICQMGNAGKTNLRLRCGMIYQGSGIVLMGRPIR